jgi:hypothetical protein
MDLLGKSTIFRDKSVTFMEGVLAKPSGKGE